MAITSLSNGFIFVPPQDWGASYGSGRPPIPIGCRDVVIHHSVTVPTDDPCEDMRKLESILAKRGRLGGYNYVAHPSGVILEGAGIKQGDHTGSFSDNSYGICLIGNFDKIQPTLAALVNISRTINLLRLVGNLTPRLEDIRIRPHRDFFGTACPGANMVGENNGPKQMDWIRWFAALGV